MASLAASEDTGSISRSQLESLQRVVLLHRPSDSDTQTLPLPPPCNIQPFEDDTVHGDPAIRPSVTLADSADACRTPTSSPLRPPARLPIAKSASHVMQPIIETEPEPNSTGSAMIQTKAVSFSGGDAVGDTQVMPSQVYHTFTESMLGVRQTTPPKMPEIHAGLDESLLSADQTMIHAHDIIGDRTPQTVQEGESGYVDLGGFQSTSPARSTQAFDELLQIQVDEEEQSPETQFRVPKRASMPETPTIAGRKHSRDGEPLTSTTTVPTAKTSHLSQFFQEYQAPTLSESQLFEQTQTRSSPLPGVLRSDPVLTRPSPSLNGDIASPPPFRDLLSSPTTAMYARPSSTGEPQGHYRSMKESQERRMARLHIEWQKHHARGSDDANKDHGDDDDGFDDDTQERRRFRRAQSDQALHEVHQIRAPPRPRSRRPRQRKPMANAKLKTPLTVRSDDMNFGDEFLVDDENANGDAETVEEDEDRLPGDAIHEDDYSEDPDVPNDNDEYDELGQVMLRSQTGNQSEDDERESIAGSVDSDDILQGNVDREMDGMNLNSEKDAGDQDLATHDTPRSTIANSQPAVDEPIPQRQLDQPAQQSSIASFVPGSQYVGKTSQDLATLASSQRKSTFRVAASQVNEENDRHIEKVPSSPPQLNPTSAILDQAFGSSLNDPNALHIQRRVPSTDEETASCREIPESDLPDIEATANQNQAAAHQETARKYEPTLETDNVAPFSTARSYISASTHSTARPPVAQSPSKRIFSQQSGLMEPSPRKAANVRHFSEMAGADTTASSFEKTSADVDDVMNAVMTREDRMLNTIMSDQAEYPQPKRPRLGRSASTHPKSVAEKCSTSASASHASLGSEHSLDGAVSKMNDITTEFASELQQARQPPQALKDSPSKANKLPGTSVRDIGTKASESITTSQLQRERAGAEAVSQLVAARTAATEKQTNPAKRLTTYSRVDRKKSGKRLGKTVQKTSKKSDRGAEEKEQALVRETTEIAAEDAQYVNQEGQTSSVMNIDSANETVVHGDLVPPPIGREEDETDNPVKAPANVAPERILALFKGAYNGWYPATWLGTSADGSTYRVRFDDTTITDVNTQLVCRLEFRVGDSVKVDIRGLKSTTWRVVGFGSPVQTDAERELGVDVCGRSRIQLQAKNRSSLSKDAAAAAAIQEDDGDTRDVLLSQVYLTHTLWAHYLDRTFIPPSTTAQRLDWADPLAARAEIAGSERPTSRGQRAAIATAPAKAVSGRLHRLRDASVASSVSTETTGIFSGMAFAISYIGNEAEKTEITRQIGLHGGLVLDDGFEELFDLPHLDEPVASSSTITSAAAAANKPSPQQQQESETASGSGGLRLKVEHRALGFVALIADRHSRRAKYVQALALGLPTLSGRWVTDSLEAARNAPIARGGEPAAAAAAAAGPVPWGKYLLPAGESAYLGGAIRSRTLAPPPHDDARAAELHRTLATRPVLLAGERVLIVAPRKAKGAGGSAVWDKRKTFVFLTLALGAGEISRVADLQTAAAALVQGGAGSGTDTNTPIWVYVDGNIAEASAAVFGSRGARHGKNSSSSSSNTTAAAAAAIASKKRKRGGREGSSSTPASSALASAGGGDAMMSATHGKVKIVSDEFVVQSLILGALVE